MITYIYDLFNLAIRLMIVVVLFEAVVIGSRWLP